jgi:hypothetical protein
MLNTEENVRTLTETMNKLLNKFDETNENILSLKREGRRPQRNREYDRYGRRVFDRTRERYANLSRDLSQDSNRSYSRDRDWFGDDRRERDRRDSFNRGYSNDKVTRDYSLDESFNRNKLPNKESKISNNKDSPKHKKRVEFDIARKLNDSRDINGDIKCFNCGRIGHFARNCPRRRDSSGSSRLNALITNDDDYDSCNDYDDLIYQTVYINNQPITALIDSDSEISLIDANLVKNLGLNLESYCGKGIKAVNGSPVRVVGEVPIEVTLKNNDEKRITQLRPAFIKDFDFSLLLGNDFNRLANILIDCKNKKLIWPLAKSETQDADCSKY